MNSGVFSAAFRRRVGVGAMPSCTETWSTQGQSTTESWSANAPPATTSGSGRAAASTRLPTGCMRARCGAATASALSGPATRSSTTTRAAVGRLPGSCTGISCHWRAVNPPTGVATTDSASTGALGSPEPNWTTTRWRSGSLPATGTTRWVGASGSIGSVAGSGNQPVVTCRAR